MKESKAIFLLFLTSLFWGMTFIFQNQAASVIEPGLFNGIRMVIGFIVLLPIFIKTFKKHINDKTYLKYLLFGGLILGLVVSLASYTQQLGIGLTTAGKAGFITSLYSLLVPVFALFTGKKTNKQTWACVFIGLCGAFMITMNEQFKFSNGDILMFVSAILFAIQIIVIDIFAPHLDGVDLSAFQFLFAGLFSFLLSIFSKEQINFEVIKLAAIPILYAGIFSCGIAYTLQIVAQKFVHPTKATLVLSLESLWAGLGGALILKETMTLREILGCALLFSAVVFSQIPLKKLKKKTK